MIIVGTAGHIDHGKTTLVLKLTGIDTDRLKEEKARGISIELGFAYIDLPGGSRVGLIDVPGHERFVHHMIAGATGVDLVMLVVAADEAVMPQTREHVAICQLLGMRRGVVIITKTDLVDPEWLALVKDDVAQYLASTFLAAAPLLEFSATWAGERLDAFRKELYSHLESLAASVEKSSVDRPFMMPVDRVFSIKGFGTVATGTVQSGRVRAGDAVVLLPSGRAARVRRIEVHGRSADESRAGTRTAVNLPDLEVEQVARGEVLAEPEVLRPVTAMAATLEAVESLGTPLKGQFKALFHTGAALAEASVKLLDRTELGPGERALVTIRLQSPVALLPGNRHVLRGFTPLAGYGKTIGGGAILWPSPVKGREDSLAMLERLATGRPAEMLEAAAWLSGPNGVPAALLPSLLPVPVHVIREACAAPSESTRVVALDVGGGTRYLHDAFFAAARDKVFEILDAYHGANPRKKGIPREEMKSRLPEYLDRAVVQAVVERLVKKGELLADDLHVFRPGFSVNLDGMFMAAARGIEAALHAGALSPPARDALPAQVGCTDKVLADALAHLVDEQKIVKVSSDLYFHRDAVALARGKLVDFLTANGTVSTQQLKDIWGLSRKYLIPLAEYFDAIRVTARVGASDRKLRGG